MSKNKQPSFEEALEELEQITRTLESGKESLEKSMELYERGTELRKICEAKLREAEGKWVVLRKDGSGKTVAEEISAEELTGDAHKSRPQKAPIDKMFDDESF